MRRQMQEVRYTKKKKKTPENHFYVIYNHCTHKEQIRGLLIDEKMEDIMNKRKRPPFSLTLQMNNTKKKTST